MKSCSIVATFFLIVLAGLVSPPGIAQQPSAGNGARAELAQAEATYVLAEFVGSLNGGRLKPGAPVRAEVAQDVLAHGKIIIPVDAKLIGHVTEVKTRGSGSASRLGIIFDKVLLKHHVEKLLSGVVYALAPPTQRRSKVDEPDQMMFPTAGAGGPSNSMPMGGKHSPPQTSTSQTVFGDLSQVTSTDPNSPVSWNRAGTSSSAPPMSVGTRPGVYGMKGVSLSADGSSETPGPIILSTASNVKLEYGTQVVIKVTDTRKLQQ